MRVPYEFQTDRERDETDRADEWQQELIDAANAGEELSDWELSAIANRARR